MAKKFNIAKSPGGVRPSNFIPPIPPFQTKPTVIIGSVVSKALKKLFINTGVEEEDITFKFSAINTPVFSDIFFEGNSYVDENDNTVTFLGLSIDLVLMTVTNQKNIVETVLQGRNGSVKEYISDGDCQIVIEGKIFGAGPNNYPQDEVQTLIEICKAPQAITVTSEYLKMFDVSSLVIRSLTLPQEEATRNYQAFTLNCLSDRDLILLKNA